MFIIFLNIYVYYIFKCIYIYKYKNIVFRLAGKKSNHSYIETENKTIFRNIENL